MDTVIGEGPATEELLHDFVDEEEEQAAEVDEVDEVAEPVCKKARDSWEWEEKTRSFRSKQLSVFPEPNYTLFKNLSPSQLFTMMFDDDIMAMIANKSNEYAMANFGLQPMITAEEISIFFAVLFLSGYNKVTDYRMYWSNSEDTENKMVKNAMSRDRFMTVKRCFHLGQAEDGRTAAGDTPDR